MTGRGLRFKLIAVVLSTVGILFAGIFSYNYIYSRGLIADLVRRNAMQLALATVHRVENVLYAVERTTEQTARSVEEVVENRGVVNGIVRGMVQYSKDIFGSTIAFHPPFESVAGGDKKNLYAPYWYKGDGNTRFRFLSYDYTLADWYLIPRELGKPVWSEPYFDVGGGECLMATYSVPFYKHTHGRREFAGIVTADVSLQWLRKMVLSITVGRTGYAFLISRNGTFIVHPDERLIMNETIFTVAEDRRDPALRGIGRRMVRGESGGANLQDWVSGSESWIVFHPLTLSGWSLGIIFPKRELLEDITRLNTMVGLLGVVGVIFLFGIVVIIGRSITRPIVALSATAERIAQGDLHAPLPSPSSRDEIATLTETFRSMQESLRHYIKELERTITEKQRIESELTIARDIQMGILPKVFPPFPERSEFDIYARLRSAREVGGDFYDFFFTDQRYFWIVIGDVSGKGVPASLFMAVTRTLVKAKANGSSSPAAVLSAVNKDLSSDNPSLMFVTIFLGVLDTQMGLFTYANGGHNPPYLAGKAREGVTRLATTRGLALGVHGDFPYRESCLTLAADDFLVLYTDGVTEAENEAKELFSADRLEQLIERLKNSSPEAMVKAILQGIDEFAGQAPQSDDITLMVMRFRGSVFEKDSV